MPVNTPPPLIAATELIDRYAVLLLDAYGVLLHGGGALPGAAACVARLNSSGKPYFILTNDATKLPATAAARYRGFGLDLDPERIISAGALLEDYFAMQGPAAKRCLVLGPADSVRYAEMAGGEPVVPGEDFEVLVVADASGYPFLQTVDTVLSGLFARIDRRQTPALVLANPDLIFPTAAMGFGLAAGSIALVLEAALQLRYPGRDELRFARLGKPHPWLFQAALQRGGSHNMVMIGDQLQTDICGANAFGIDSALVTGGVSGATFTLPPSGPRPTYLVESLLA